jgi:cobalt-zinc-cadmium efflux system protein
MARRSLTLALAFTALVAALELWGGLRSRSLALTGDAVHVAMDLFALALALAVAIGAARPADPRRTFGYGRLEVLGALVNAALLIAAAIAIVVFAAQRFAHPVQPHAATMTAVAFAGLALNLCAGWALHRDSRANLNVRAALFHVLSDALGAVVVAIGGVLIAFTHAAWIDPLLSLVVAGIVLVGVVRIVRDAGSVLLESVPRDVDSAALIRRLSGVAGVCGVHDLHVWSIASGSHALSAHVLLDDRRLSEATEVLREIDRVLQSDFNIAHATIQFECDSCPVIVRH